MNTSQLTAALNKIYNEEQTRIVFWNDPEQEFEQILDTIELPDVEVLRINRNGSFETKILVEHEKPSTRFLLYTPEEEPEYQQDVLLDLRLYARSFRADRSSIIHNELGLANASVRDHLSLRRKFFDNKQRMAKLQPLVSADDNEADLDLKMMAVVCKADQPEFFNVVRTLFHSIAEQESPDPRIAPPAWEQLEKFELDDRFWALAQDKFGYEDSDPTLHKLLMRMLLTDFSVQLRDAAPIAINKLKLAGSGVQNTVVCIDQWRDSGRQASSYNLLADSIAAEINVANEIDSLELEQLANATTFGEVDKKILSLLVKRLEETRDHVTAADFTDIVSVRQQAHWIASPSIEKPLSDSLYSAYETIGKAATFFEMKHQHAAGFEVDSAGELYSNYTNTLYQFDQLYRHCCYHTEIAARFDPIKSLCNELEAAYCNWYLPTLELAWDRFMGSETGNWLQNWHLPDVTNQYHFYNRYVAPRKKKARAARTFVVISDALRYEAGAELAARINGQYRFNANLSTQLGVLPSYTKLGMASLLPHTTLSYTAKGDVLADGTSTSSTESRQKILDKVDGISVLAEDLLKLKSQQSRDLISGKDVVYIYHNVIDSRGDNRSTESDTFRATDEAIGELFDIVSHIINKANGSYILITADHGFLYTESSPDETNRSKLDTKPKGTVLAKKRYLIGHDLPDNTDVWQGSTKDTAKCADDMQFWIPKGANRFHFTGGARFIHGGAMPQEVVVPVIEVTEADSAKAKDQTRTRMVPVSVLGNTHKVTTASHRFKLVQMEPVSERAKAITLKVALYDGDEVISSMETIPFDNTSTNTDERTKTVKLILKDQPFDKHNDYRLVLKDSVTDFEHDSCSVTIDRAINDDFDF